jgi:8-oxo-dGTP pyrophosphatase MutT (NUDIX family)
MQCNALAQLKRVLRKPALYQSEAFVRKAPPNKHRHSRMVVSMDGGSSPVFTVLDEEVKFRRYLTLYNRRVLFPPTPAHPEPTVHEFDIIGHPTAAFHFSIAFPFHPASSGDWRDGHVTVLREYAQGTNKMVYGFPAGAFDPQKHSNYEECARAELSEEAHLKAGRLVLLLEEGVAVPEVKWCRNRFTPFLALDLQPDDQPGERDKEEYIEVLRVGIPELRRIARSGEMLLASVATCWWAFEYLAEEQDKLNDKLKL